MSKFTSHSGHLPRLLAMAKAYMPSRAFLTALELDVFGRLGEEQLSASQIAERIGADERATEILLNALVGLEILSKKGNRFANIDSLARVLVPGNPEYVGGGLLHNANLWEAWSNLTETVKTGQPLKREWTKQMSEGLALAMRQHAASAAEKMVRILDCSNVNRMLDVGGGPGSYALAFTRHYPNLRAVIFDKDELALEIAREEIGRQNLEERISLMKGDFFSDDLGGNYDLVLLSSIICICGEKENAILLEKVYRALADGGRIVIRDSILDESRTKPVSAAIFALNMLVATHNGRSYSDRDVKDMLLHSGFRDIYHIPVDGSHLVIGVKQAGASWLSTPGA